MDYPSDLYMNGIVLYTKYESSTHGMQATQACVRKPHAPRTTIWRLKREAMIGNERHVGPRLWFFGHLQATIYNFYKGTVRFLATW